MPADIRGANLTFARFFIAVSIRADLAFEPLAMPQRERAAVPGLPRRSRSAIMRRAIDFASATPFVAQAIGHHAWEIRNGNEYATVLLLFYFHTNGMDLNHGRVSL